MPLPRTFSTDLKRTLLYTVSEEDAISLPESEKSVNEKTNRSGSTKSVHAKLSSSSPFPSLHHNDSDISITKQLETVLDLLKCLNDDVRQVFDKQQQLSAEQAYVLDTKLEHLSKVHSDIIQRIATSQSEVSALCQGIEQLKHWTESTHHRSDNLSVSASIESLVTCVTKHNEDLVDLTAAFKSATKAQKTTSAEQKEALTNLKRTSNESKSLLEEMWFAYEKDSLILRKEQQALLAEKEKLAKDIALFEQRKLAAKDEIEHAAAMTRTMKETGAKVSFEMERLIQLSEFVVAKEKQADQKLAEAQRLSKQLEEWQDAIANDHEAVQQMKKKMEDDRIRLSRDRVSILKSKPSNEMLPLGRSTKVNLMHDFSSAHLGELRHRLVTSAKLKAEMERFNEA